MTTTVAPAESARASVPVASDPAGPVTPAAPAVEVITNTHYLEAPFGSGTDTITCAFTGGMGESGNGCAVMPRTADWTPLGNNVFFDATDGSYEIDYGNMDAAAINREGIAPAAARGRIQNASYELAGGGITIWIGSYGWSVTPGTVKEIAGPAPF